MNLVRLAIVSRPGRWNPISKKLFSLNPVGITETATQSGCGCYPGLKVLLCMLTLQLWMASPTSAIEITCHIHPPAQGKDRTSPATTLGPFATDSTCASVRQQMFGNAGRCHCVPGFASPGIRGRAQSRRLAPETMQHDQPLP